MEKALQELLDIHAIEQLMVRYADRIDANDPEGAAACYAEDGIGKYWGTFQGRQEISEVLSAILSMFSTTSHHLSNININLEGDQATAMSYVYAFHRTADTDEPIHYWGRWVDRLMRTDEGWLFAEREVLGVGSIAPEHA
ncbi:MAG: nuclear transport factor 2 family protein, partial [Deltaproteobacteria bacterium]|nr:nuclear transport factor 2 family protein [Deltaproteobacteria bacterium]